MLKLFQLSAARLVVCLMSVSAPDRLTVAWPATSCSPVGPAAALRTAAPWSASSASATAAVIGASGERRIGVLASH
jgi:hypothetical protein